MCYLASSFEIPADILWVLEVFGWTLSESKQKDE